ncbi:uncharacterized protein N7446_005562 [Penicillium canescens]|uniref:Uncharacterized protein n=1 Tax=Penicillium canescens TaxID=5083 RepID=A0AAD6IHZ5_PENCN|nr:uncharacterized protein N7446_005562 [Penicillium canescens]KAJ6050200.1 hypothetical protein N7444_006916 [Penicillium canescens]KAJ6050934.1 hypothetical protein N7460_001468 [Penicillium canescens]KAJ6061442.1 hypothetical protein N7446_005562 [Penicillium canescens]
MPSPAMKCVKEGCNAWALASQRFCKDHLRMYFFLPSSTTSSTVMILTLTHGAKPAKPANATNANAIGGAWSTAPVDFNQRA